jgi:hypothetical protein
MSLTQVAYLAVVAASLAAGCSAEMRPPLVRESEAVASVPAVNCPNRTTDCTMSNGTGIYQEVGSPSLDDTLQLMLTYFRNTGESVEVHGRYHSPGGAAYFPDGWIPLQVPGTVSASYKNQNYQVRSVSETGTNPIWTLSDGNSQISVTGVDLLNLKLMISFAKAKLPLPDYLFEFVSYSTENRPTKATTLHEFHMRWRPVTNGVAGAQRPYCAAANHGEDWTVFQQGIYVHPATGLVLRNKDPETNVAMSGITDDFVTVSCRLGTPATVYWWGYDHRAKSSSWYFDSAVALKRANYCGDGTPWTKDGTGILIDGNDDATVLRDVIAAPNVEALWTPQGASCINLSALRQPTMGFSGTCGETVLPACPDLSALPSHQSAAGDRNDWLTSGLPQDPQGPACKPHRCPAGAIWDPATCECSFGET